MRLRLNSRILNVISSFGGCLDALILGLKPLLPGARRYNTPPPLPVSWRLQFRLQRRYADLALKFSL